MGYIALCTIMNMKFNAETMMVTGKNLFIKEPMALTQQKKRLNYLGRFPRSKIF